MAAALPKLCDSDYEDDAGSDNDDVDIGNFEPDIGFDGDELGDGVFVESDEDDEDEDDEWNNRTDAVVNEKSEPINEPPSCAETSDDVLDSLLSKLDPVLSPSDSLDEGIGTLSDVKSLHISDDGSASDNSDVETVICTSELENQNDLDDDDMDLASRIERKTLYDEANVDLDDLPPFICRKTCYGTAFNLLSGAVVRPPRDEYVKKDDIWIQYARLSCEEKKIVDVVENADEKLTPIAYGSVLNFEGKSNINIITKTWKDLMAFETIDFQKIVRMSFNSRKYTTAIFGVEEDGKVTGCALNSEMRDNIRLALDTALQYDFIPPIENALGVCDISFVPVTGAPNDETYVAILRVTQKRNQDYKLAFDSLKE